MDTNAMNFTGMWMGTWAIILILFILFNNNGWFGWWRGGWNAAWLLNGMNNNNNHDNTVDIINNNTSWSQQMMAQQNLANQTNLISTGFCGVNQNIDRSIYEAQKNTCDIMQNCTANTQKILDMLCAQETQRLRTELAEARVIAQNNAQTSELLSKLQPVAIPSYIVSSPYTSIYPPATTTPATVSGS